MSEVLWVAEIGSMHKGSKALAFELIRKAKEAGATIAKFQFGWTKKAQNEQGLKYDPVRYVDDWVDELRDWCAYFNIELMASIWSKEGLETARRAGLKRYKIAHQKASDSDFLKMVLADGRETFISSPNQLPSSVEGDLKRIIVSPDYPCYPRNLKITHPLGYVVNYGYSDHTHGIEACLLAVARGALYVEKHFCLDKTDLTVRDTTFSATPDEFAEMVRIGNGLRRLLDVGA